MADIAVDPSNASHWLIGAVQGGIWETRDAGATWTARTDAQASLAMGAIALAPGNPDIIYAGTGKATFAGDAYGGAGILNSTDGGTTWQLLGASVDRLNRVVANDDDGTSNTSRVTFPTPAGSIYYIAVDGFGGVSGNIALHWTLTVPLYTLTVTLVGSGSGSVKSSPAGITCGTDCTEAYNSGTVITLTATPASGSTCAGWSGHSDCTDGIRMLDANTTCTATFARASGPANDNFSTASGLVKCQGRARARTWERRRKAGNPATPGTRGANL